MLNLYDSIRTNPAFRTLEMGDVLFAEYTCPIGEEQLGVYSHTDYLVHVVSGKKTWQTMDGDCTAEPGDTLFFRKGAAVVRQFFEQDFCLLMFSIPDRLVREIVRGMPEVRSVPAETLRCATPVVPDVVISAFLQSMRTYFSGEQRPPEPWSI